MKLNRNLRSPRDLRRQHARLELAFHNAQDCARELGMRRLLRDLDRVGQGVTRLDRQIERVRVARYDRRDRHDRSSRYDRRSRHDRRDRYDRRHRYPAAGRHDRDHDRHPATVASRWPIYFGSWLGQHR